MFLAFVEWIGLDGINWGVRLVVKAMSASCVIPHCTICGTMTSQPFYDPIRVQPSLPSNARGAWQFIFLSPPPASKPLFVSIQRLVWTLVSAKG